MQFPAHLYSRQRQFRRRVGRPYPDEIEPPANTPLQRKDGRIEPIPLPLWPPTLPAKIWSDPLIAPEAHELRPITRRRAPHQADHRRRQ
jgi:hypothetical protein